VERLALRPAALVGSRETLVDDTTNSSTSDISSEKITTACPAMAAFSAMLATSADLPMPGRAASTVRDPG
jgi:hypothetical protein